MFNYLSKLYLIVMISFTFSQDCVDEGTTITGGFPPVSVYYDCTQLLAGYSCGSELMDTYCPVTCGTCPSEGLSGCDLSSNSIFINEDGNVLYNSDTVIAGFQFTVEGATIVSASGGDAEEAGLLVSTGAANALGVSLSGGSIDAGCGTLTELSLNGVPTGLSSIIISDASAQAIDISYYGSGCTDSSACNFDSDAITDDGSCLANDCNGECGGTAINDECGVCNGSGIPVGECDCNGNILDECGACGGSGIPVGECDCNGSVLDALGACGGTCAADSDDDNLCDDVDDCVGAYDACNVCNGPGDIYECGCSDIAQGACDCDGSVADNCGVCSGDGSSCALFIESSVSIEVDESDLDDLEVFESNFEELLEFQLGLPQGSVEVISITIVETRAIEIIVEYAITLTDEELAEYPYSAENIQEDLAELEQDINDEGFIFIEGCTDIDASNYNEFATVDDGTCLVSSTIDYQLDLSFGANLVSFYALPEDASLSNVLSSLDGAITGIIGQGVAASPNPILGWVGSLSSINSLSGYWIKVDQSAILSIEDATPTDPANALYNLQFGANLISFPSQDPVAVGDAIPDDVEDKFLGVIGQGVAASPNPILGWVGSLSQFEGGKGYWAKVDEAISFYFNTESSNLRTNLDDRLKPFVQSTQQAFYFIENINLEGLGSIEVGNVIKAYNDNILVGQREWNGSIVDIPAMGNDGSLPTAGYCEQGDEIRLTVTLSDGVEYELNGEIPKWSNNELFTLKNLSVSESTTLPSNISIIGAYPNPFNPVTNILYNLNSSTDIDVSVYNTSGQFVANLFNGKQDAGQHKFEFSGNNLSSGMYLVKISSEDDVQTQKVLLMK